MSDLEFASQFTEDAVAKEDLHCERPACGTLIPKGNPRIYIATIDNVRPGRYVCFACYQRYAKKLSTSVRQKAAPTIGGSSNVSSVPDLVSIRQAVTAAQRKSTIRPPSVMPMPPLLPPAGSSSQGPVIHVPSRTNAVSHGPSRSVQGYGPQHAQYASERERWARLCSAPTRHPAETITLDITALHEGGGGSRKGRLHGTPFGSISEGKRGVDAHITAPQLVDMALQVIVPRIKAFSSQFGWREDEFVVRDASWVDLARYERPYEPYFYEDCLVPVSRKSVKDKVFKSKQFVIFVVVPTQQWNEYEAFVEKSFRSPERPTHALTIPRCSRPTVVSPTPTSVAPTQNFSRPRTVAPLETDRATTPYEESDALFSPEPSTRADLSTKNPVTSSTREAIDLTISPHPTATKFVGVQRGYAHVDAMSGTASPSTRKQTSSRPDSELAKFDSPDPNRLRDALEFGGDVSPDAAEIIKMKRDLVEFYSIPNHSVAQILADPLKRSFRLKSIKLVAGQMWLDGSRSGLIGFGGFKTTQLARLTLGTKRPTGIGAESSQAIAVKRFYLQRSTSAANTNMRFIRFSVSDEIDKLCREANILYWAKALLKLTYDFIDHSVAHASTTPPFVIPRLRFVDAGILLAITSSHGSGKTLKGTNDSNVHTPYLAEELIPQDDPFIKYIHNGDPTPLPDRGELGYDLAEFLVFTQHVQYVKTGGLAYISDYQGSSSLLTDPQILTHPIVGKGKDLFGEGNLEIGVKLFVKEHICNHFCQWPGFALPSPGSITSD